MVWLIAEVTQGACSFTADSGNVSVMFATCEKHISILCIEQISNHGKGVEAGFHFAHLDHYKGIDLGGGDGGEEGEGGVGDDGEEGS